jgi:hypothetical protein
MFDRMLSHGLTLAIIGLVSVGFGGGLFLLFVAWNECLSGWWMSAMGHVIGAVAAILGVWWLCHYREELADL